jgi:hypothetical protein
MVSVKCAASAPLLASAPVQHKVQKRGRAKNPATLATPSSVHFSFPRTRVYQTGLRHNSASLRIIIHLFSHITSIIIPIITAIIIIVLLLSPPSSFGRLKTIDSVLSRSFKKWALHISLWLVDCYSENPHERGRFLSITTHG